MPGDSNSTLSVIVKLVDEASAGLKNVAANAKVNLENIKSNAEEVRNSFGLMGGAIVAGLGVLVKQAADSATADMQLTTAVRAGIAAATDDAGSTDLLTKQKALLQSQLHGLTGKIQEYNDKINAGKDGNGQYAASLVLVQQKAAAIEDSLSRLDNEQKLVGQSSEEIVRQFEQAARTGVDYGFANDETVKSLTSLFRATGSVEQALRINQEAMDLSRAKGIDLATSGTLIIQAMEGNARALKQFGINLKDGLTPAEALNELQTKLANSAKDYVNTPWGQLEVAKAKAGLLAETLGASLLPALSTILQILTPLIQRFADWAAAHPQLLTAILVTVGAIGVLFLAISAIAAIVGAFTAALLALWPVIVAVGVVMTALAGPIIALGILIGVLAFIVTSRWNDIKVGTQVVWDAITGIIKVAVDYITGLVQGMWSTVNGIIGNIVNAVNSAKNAVSGFGSNVAAGASVVQHAIIPKFASGGIVTGPTLGLIGEAGPEAVIPLSKMGSMNGTNINITITGNTISNQMDLHSITNAVSAEIVRALRLNGKYAI